MDKRKRALPSLEGAEKSLRGNYRKRKYAQRKCYQAAAERGYRYFAIQNGGQCFAGAKAESRYDIYGGSNKCRKGKGGPWANDIYEINGEYAAMGCWKDTKRRAIPGLEGTTNILKGKYRTRKDAIQKCYEAASKKGFKYFAIQDNGWCAASKNAKKRYRMYGRSTACRGGKGGRWANSVYIILA